MNKKANLHITIFVFLIVGLVGATLIVFLQNMRSVETSISDARFLNTVYFEETQIDFIVEKMIEESMDASYGNREIFLKNFEEVIEMYSEYEKFLPYILEIKKQVNSDNLVVTLDSVSLRLSFHIEKRLGDKMVVNYLYEKEFKKKYGEIRQ